MIVRTAKSQALERLVSLPWHLEYDDRMAWLWVVLYSQREQFVLCELRMYHTRIM